MRANRFAVGLCLGAVLGVLATIGVHQAVARPPAHLEVSGIARVDTATHQDFWLDNRVYLDGPVFLQGPVYLESDTIDVNVLDSFHGKPVRVTGPVEKLRVKDGYSVILVNAVEIKQVKNPQHFQ